MVQTVSASLLDIFFFPFHSVGAGDLDLSVSETSKRPPASARFEKDPLHQTIITNVARSARGHRFPMNRCLVAE